MLKTRCSKRAAELPRHRAQWQQLRAVSVNCSICMSSKTLHGPDFRDMPEQQQHPQRLRSSVI